MISIDSCRQRLLQVLLLRGGTGALSRKGGRCEAAGDEEDLFAWRVIGVCRKIKKVRILLYRIIQLESIETFMPEIAAFSPYSDLPTFERCETKNSGAKDIITRTLNRMA